jgi:hypothetical protein
MFRRALALALALAPAAPLAADRVAGLVQTDQGQIEILGQPVRVGERVDLPEGWYRVEEAGPEDGRVGSFGIVSASSFPASAPAVAADPPEEGAPGAGKKAVHSCGAERTAFLKELLRGSGVEVQDPASFLEGLGGDEFAPGLSTLWLALATDPVRSLSWSSELRSRADALARCARAN